MCRSTPSYYHIKQLEEYEAADFEITKKNGEYHAHISLKKEVVEKPTISIGGIDQGLNRSIATVLLTMRKRTGKWYYSRQCTLIALKRAEMGYSTKLVDERYTSKTCHICRSLLTERKWVDGNSYILCHSCDSKVDADINAAYNIALRCRDDRLKVQMNTTKMGASA